MTVPRPSGDGAAHTSEAEGAMCRSFRPGVTAGRLRSGLDHVLALIVKNALTCLFPAFG